MNRLHYSWRTPKSATTMYMGGIKWRTHRSATTISPFHDILIFLNLPPNYRIILTKAFIRCKNRNRTLKHAYAILPLGYTLFFHYSNSTGILQEFYNLSFNWKTLNIFAIRDQKNHLQTQYYKHHKSKHPQSLKFTKSYFLTIW